MARTGEFGGFAFDKDVFSEYMSEQNHWKSAIIASGIIREDDTIKSLIGSKGNVGTMPFYIPLDADAEGMAPLNYDGKNDNTPVETKGSKQTFMSIERMKAFKAKDFTKELTGANPLTDVAGKVGGYYQQVWQNILMKIVKGIMGTEGMAEHKTDISVAEGSISDTNLVSETSFIDLGQKALGDMADRFRLIIMHSKIYANLQKKNLIVFNKYTVAGAALESVELPTYNGKIVVVDDRNTVDTTVVGFPKYHTYLVGEGAFLSSTKDLENPYYADYDAETAGGTEALYTKQARVLHPNGFSFAVDNVVEESPTDAELSTSGNWTLKFNHKNVAIAEMITNG